MNCAEFLIALLCLAAFSATMLDAHRTATGEMEDVQMAAREESDAAGCAAIERHFFAYAGYEVFHGCNFGKTAVHEREDGTGKHYG
ncbi:MAG TPA: hypothetical protein HA254_07520 [Candidatus Diapherotrites archaeon]|uniref:Uncharacterized protein n=1 Tax=Candidatus Iainarchaeum sp. TaxID=3101447 RepID=A0A7J4J5J0_9ARCH|nr:hypothetical protein [Candidatus Diapherotrites archaeon]